MNEVNCEYVRDVYPDVLNGQADAALATAVRAHLARCAECREETEAVDAIFAGSLVAPAGLHERVMKEFATQPGHRRSSGLRYITIAATVAAALIGGSLLWNRTADNAGQPVVINESREPDLGVVTVEAALVSGTESLQDLTVEELEQLLGEIES
jgi:anti-sigma factor RsiW